MILERFDGYWREWEAGQFDRVVIRVVPEGAARRQLVERGDADIVDGLDPEARGAGARPRSCRRSQLQHGSRLHHHDCRRDRSREARQALCYAFPYDEVIEGIYKGYGKRAVGPVAEICRGFAPRTFQYQTDLAKAKDLLAQAGVAEGTELTLMMDAGDAADASTVQLFQANLAEIGITLSVETVTFSTLTGVLFRDVAPEEQPNLMQWGWWPAYNDAWSHLQAQVLCSAQDRPGPTRGTTATPAWTSSSPRLWTPPILPPTSRRWPRRSRSSRAMIHRRSITCSRSGRRCCAATSRASPSTRSTSAPLTSSVSAVA